MITTDLRTWTAGDKAVTGPEGLLDSRAAGAASAASSTGYRLRPAGCVSRLAA
jgi:hypothetical protein